MTVVNGVGPGGNGLSGNPGSATDFLVHIRFIHMDFPHLQNGLCRLTEIVLDRCIVPTQDGYYYIVVVECPVSTNGLLDVTQLSASGTSFLVNSSAPLCLILFCSILLHFIMFLQNMHC